MVFNPHAPDQSAKSKTGADGVIKFIEASRYNATARPKVADNYIAIKVSEEETVLIDPKTIRSATLTNNHDGLLRFIYTTDFSKGSAPFEVNIPLGESQKFFDFHTLNHLGTLPEAPVGWDHGFPPPQGHESYWKPGDKLHIQKPEKQIPFLNDQVPSLRRSEMFNAFNRAMRSCTERDNKNISSIIDAIIAEKGKEEASKVKLEVNYGTDTPINPLFKKLLFDSCDKAGLGIVQLDNSNDNFSDTVKQTLADEISKPLDNIMYMAILSAIEKTHLIPAGASVMKRADWEIALHQFIADEGSEKTILKEAQALVKISKKRYESKINDLTAGMAHSGIKNFNTAYPEEIRVADPYVSGKFPRREGYDNNKVYNTYESVIRAPESELNRYEKTVKLAHLYLRISRIRDAQDAFDKSRETFRDANTAQSLENVPRVIDLDHPSNARVKAVYHGKTPKVTDFVPNVHEMLMLFSSNVEGRQEIQRQALLCGAVRDEFFSPLPGKPNILVWNPIRAGVDTKAYSAKTPEIKKFADEAAAYGAGGCFSWKADIVKNLKTLYSPRYILAGFIPIPDKMDTNQTTQMIFSNYKRSGLRFAWSMLVTGAYTLGTGGYYAFGFLRKENKKLTPEDSKENYSIPNLHGSLKSNKHSEGQNVAKELGIDIDQKPEPKWYEKKWVKSGLAAAAAVTGIASLFVEKADPVTTPRNLINTNGSSNNSQTAAHVQSTSKTAALEAAINILKNTDKTAPNYKDAEQNFIKELYKARESVKGNGFINKELKDLDKAGKLPAGIKLSAVKAEETKNTAVSSTAPQKEKQQQEPLKTGPAEISKPSVKNIIAQNKDHGTESKWAKRENAENKSAKIQQDGSRITPKSIENDKAKVNVTSLS